MWPSFFLMPALRATFPRLRRPSLTHGWRDAILQLILLGCADLLYEAVRGLVAGQAPVALANAGAIVSLERTLGVFIEPQAQAVGLEYHWLVVAANWFYMNCQFTLTALFLAWVYAYRNHAFYFVRNMFGVSMAIALVVHLLVPVAPPRMLPQWGFVDTIASVAHINQDSGAVGTMVNPYAAVPSMHMCFALLVGFTGLRLSTRRWLRGVWVAYPLVVLAVIVVTANHFLFDALTGAVTAAVAAVAAHHLMARARPARWSWAPDPTGAAGPR